MIYIIPDNVPEERLAHDFLRVRGSTSQALIRLARQEFLEDRNRVAWHVYGIQRLVCQNGIIDFVLILAPEWGLLQKHLVDEDTECPPVYGTPVLFVQENLLQVS